jgi:hypothetical protein
MLDRRRIHVSLDGPALGFESLCLEVIKIANYWRSVSKHEITISTSDYNLGLYNHFRYALGDFFKRFEYGLILEDDMEFRIELINFLDSTQGQEALESYWSVCGYNPIQIGDRVVVSRGEKLQFFESEVHTIWGWASSAKSINTFLSFTQKYSKNIDELNDVIDAFAIRTCKDPIMRRALIANWRGKMARAVSSEKPNWDNFWVLAGWASKKKSLLPAISLSRENPDAYGFQTHERTTHGEIWSENNNARYLDYAFPVQIKGNLKISLLKVWGTSRISAYKQFIAAVLNRLR